MTTGVSDLAIQASEDIAVAKAGVAYNDLYADRDLVWAGDHVGQRLHHVLLRRDFAALCQRPGRSRKLKIKRRPYGGCRYSPALVFGTDRQGLRGWWRRAPRRPIASLRGHRRMSLSIWSTGRIPVLFPSAPERSPRPSRNPGDPFALVRIEASELTANPTRLADEAYAVSMFSSRRAILVRDGGGRSDLAGRFRTLFKQPPTDTAIVVEAGDLKKSNPLRVLFEQESRAYAIPCFADDERSIGALIDEEARAAGLAIAPEARALLVSLLGGDRLMTRGEIQKLCLHAHGTGAITLADVETLIGDEFQLCRPTR